MKMKGQISKLSPSSINTFFSCPRLFYHRYILGEDIEPNIHLYRGKLVHSVIEDIFEDTSSQDDLVTGALNYFDARWNPQSEIQDLSDEESEKFKNESLKMLEFFFENFEKQLEIATFNDKIHGQDHAWNLLKPRLNEHRIELKDEKLVGIIDAIQEDFDDHTFLIDYKTSKLYQNVVKQDHIRQLRIYAYLYYKDKGEMPDYVGVNYLKYGKTFLFPVNEEMIKQAKNDIEFVRENIDSTDIEDYPRGCDNPDYCDCRSFEK